MNINLIYNIIIISCFIFLSFSYHINTFNTIRVDRDDNGNSITFKGINNKYKKYHGYGKSLIDLNDQSQSLKISSTDTFENSFFDQLNDYEKDVYKTVYKNSNKNSPTVNIVLVFSYKVPASYFSFEKIFSAITLDYPQFWWISSYTASVKTETDDDGNEKTRVTMGLLSNSGNVFSNYTSDQIFTINRELETTKQEIIDQIMSSPNLTTKYSILKYLHDYLVRSINYKPHSTSPHIYTVYGALVQKEAISDGYAEAMKYLASQFNINVVVARSDRHSWNFAEINGKWYILDVTKDDPYIQDIYTEEETGDTIIELLNPETGDDRNLIHDYFLVGTKTKIKDKAFYEKNDYKLVYSAYSNKELLVYPTIEEEAYVYSEENDENVSFDDQTTSSSSEPVSSTTLPTPSSTISETTPSSSSSSSSPSPSSSTSSSPSSSPSPSSSTSSSPSSSIKATDTIENIENPTNTITITTTTTTTTTTKTQNSKVPTSIDEPTPSSNTTDISTLFSNSKKQAITSFLTLLSCITSLSIFFIFI